MIDILREWLPIAGAVAGIVAVLITAWLVVIVLRALRGMREWITPDTEGSTPIGTIIESIARTAVQSKQASSAADASGDARRLLASQADLIQHRLTEEQPTIAAAASMAFGKNWGKTLAKHPEWLGAALELGPKLLGGLGGPDGAKAITDLGALFGGAAQNVTNGNGAQKSFADLIPPRGK